MSSKTLQSVMKMEEIQKTTIWCFSPSSSAKYSHSICKEISQEQPVLIVGWRLSLPITFLVPSSQSPICLPAGKGKQMKDGAEKQQAEVEDKKETSVKGTRRSEEKKSKRTERNETSMNKT